MSTTVPEVDGAIDEIESALHALAQALKQVRLHEHLLARARVDVDRAGVALLYVLYMEGASLRVTDLAEQLRIDAPAVTRKAQQLEKSGLVGRSRDPGDARATRLQLTAQGRRTINRILAARRAWLTTVLSSWPKAEQSELARLLCLLVESVDRQLKDLDG
jgi:DNA-binding MarR family transcriptional regulator